MIKFNICLFAFALISCSAGSQNNTDNEITENAPEIVDSVIVEEKFYCNDDVAVGAEVTEAYFSKLEGLKIAVVGNQSSMVGDTHLVDTLISAGLDVVRVFSPEHGFRGTADAGEKVNNEIDEKTGVPIVSLYGNNRKPTAAQLKDVDVVLFDIQDVGVRFYTYISTLHYVMEAVAEEEVKLIVLDRPNPNGHYVDGPILKSDFSSFVGMHEVPVVHGMTVGEYAQMINGEKWLSKGISCELEVIPCEGWDHTKFYELPIAPSPNLPNMASVYLYPSLCFFEGTVVSIGRGTDSPFQLIGHPDYKIDSTQADFEFAPERNGGSKHPKLENETCYGVNLAEIDLGEFRAKGELDFTYLFDFYQNLEMGKAFFLPNNFIDLLAGSSDLRKGIINGVSLEEMEKEWSEGLAVFKEMRSKYLLYSE